MSKQAFNGVRKNQDEAVTDQNTREGKGGQGKGWKKKEGEKEFCVAKIVSQWDAERIVQGRVFTGAQSITEATKTSRRGGRGKERAEKMKLCQLPGRLLRHSNLQIHLSPQILGQTSLVWGGTPWLSPYPGDLRSPSGKLREQVYLLCHGVWILLHTLLIRKMYLFHFFFFFTCSMHSYSSLRSHCNMIWSWLLKKANNLAFCAIKLWKANLHFQSSYLASGQRHPPDFQMVVPWMWARWFRAGVTQKAKGSQAWRDVPFLPEKKWEKLGDHYKSRHLHF